MKLLVLMLMLMLMMMVLVLMVTAGVVGRQVGTRRLLGGVGLQGQLRLLARQPGEVVARERAREDGDGQRAEVVLGAVDR
jgi:hypothetical protein